MAKKRKKAGGTGVPEWVVTFGDMMSLLLCFFILLMMFSELKQEREYQRVVTAIREAFGYSGGIGVAPIEDPPLKSLVEVLETMALRSDNESTKVSANSVPGIDGPHMRVTKIREGIVFTIGGPSTFDPMSAIVKEPVKEEIRRIAVLLAGRKNKIEIVGHAAAKHLPEGGAWRDLDDLSWERAKNVKAILAAYGLDDDVFRLQGVGMREPVRPRAVEPADAAENRRVEIILTEVLVEETNSDAFYTDDQGARGG
jgi:chemotaxis protein MotB